MKIAIIGRGEILYDTVIALQKFGHEISCIVTAKEAPEYTRTASDFNNLSNTLGVPFLRTTQLNKHIATLRDVDSSIAISVNFPTIISKEIINLFPLGILNAHGGDLPRYRGNACQAWALLNGEDKIGLCIHKMVGGALDSGDIISREYLPVDVDTKINDVLIWMKERAPDLFLEAVEKLTINPEYILESQSEDAGAALRCYPRRPEDGLIDWSRSARDVLRLINASGPPYCGAFTSLEEKTIVILQASLDHSEENFCAIPGQITFFDKQKKVFCVATGSGKLVIEDVRFRDSDDNVFNYLVSTRQRLT